jgi:transcriptional regulator with XRE-family HTH domain
VAGTITRQLQREKRAVCTVLLEARVRAGLTQRAVAARLGWNQRTVHDIETGERRLAVEEFLVYAAALGTTPARLLRAIERLL